MFRSSRFASLTLKSPLSRRIKSLPDMGRRVGDEVIEGVFNPFFAFLTSRVPSVMTYSRMEVLGGQAPLGEGGNYGITKFAQLPEYLNWMGQL